MKSDLEEVIEAYEIEKVELEKQISEYVAERDYIYAHYHNKALRRINRRLDVLKGLKNPFYKDILEEERKIYFLKGLTARTNYKDDGGLIEEKISKSESKILELQNSTTNQVHDSQGIDDALFNLEKGEAKGFKLYFKSSPDLFLHFTSGDQIIQINLIYETDSYNDYQYILEESNQLKALGFKQIERQWIYQYHFTQFKDALEIKILLARLIYDVFHYDRRFDSAKIVYD